MSNFVPLFQDLLSFEDCSLLSDNIDCATATRNIHYLLDMADKIKSFFQKKKANAKFMKAGKGHK